MNWLKQLFVKFAAKYLAKKLDLKEGTPKEGVPWYRSRGVWTGIVTTAIGTYESVRLYVAPQFGHTLPEIPPSVYSILGILGIYFRANSQGPIAR